MPANNDTRAPSHSVRRHRRTRMLALEPRVLFDGVAITDMPDVSTKPTPSAEAAGPRDPLVVLIGEASPAQRTQSESTGPHNLIVSGEERAAAPARAALEQSLQLAERHLADLVHDAGYDAVMREIYGGDVTDDALQRLREDVARGSLGVRVELVAPDVLYGNAACYAAAGPGGGERIYVNADWLAHASRDEAALVLLEETGHAMDRRLNAVDTPGDEGELFSYRATRTPLDAAQYDRIRGEDDSGVVQIDGRSVVVEFSVSTTNPGPYSYVDTAADDGTFASQTGTLKTGGNNDKIQGIWTGSGYASSIAVQNGAGTVTLGTLSLSAGTIGKGSTTNAGTWTFTPDSAAIQGLTTNELNRTVRIDAKSGQTTTSVTLTFNFYGADDVPAGTSRTITTAEDTSYAFRAADFGFSDRDAGDALSAVRIDTLPSASSGTLQLSGVAVTAGQVIAAQDLGALTYAPAANANGAALGSFAFSVRDTAGNAYAAAPGVITLDVTAVNDAPTVSAPASYILTEDTAAQLVYQGTPFADVDSGTLTVTLSIADGSIAASAGAGISLGGTTTARTFTGTAADLNAYFTASGHIAYTPAQDVSGARTLTTTVSDGATASSASTLVSIEAVNDAPVVTVPSSATVPYGATYTFAGGAIVVADVDAAMLQVTVAATHGIVTLSGTSGLTFGAGANGSAAMTFTGTPSDVNAALHDLTYAPDSGYGGAALLTVTANDLGGTGAGGALTDAASVAITIAPNEAPVNTLPAAQTVAEDSMLALSGVSVSDPDGNLASSQVSVVHGTLNVSLAGGAAISGGANGSPLLKLTGTQAQINAALATLTYRPVADYCGSDTLTLVSADSAGIALTDTDALAITVTPVADVVADALTTREDSAVVANVLTGTGGASADTFSSSAVLAGITQGMHGSVTYAADGTVQYTPDADWSGSDSFAYTVSSGGVSETGTVSVTVSAVNDAPALAATGIDPSYVAGASAVQLFTGVRASMGAADESAQTFTRVVIGVTGIAQQNSERLTVDGTEFLIKRGVSGTTAGGNAISYAVNMASGGATSGTITLTSAAGLTPQRLESILAGILYRYSAANPVAGNRVFTIASVTDSGGTANGGVDTATPGIASTVHTVTANTPPTLAVTALDPQYTEADGVGTLASPVAVFANSVVSTVEAGQLITGLAFTVSGLADGAYEEITLDGTTVALEPGSGVTANNGFAYAVTLANGVATVSLTSGGVSAATISTVIDGITYRNANADNPTPGARVFTITQLSDNGGTANGGADTAVLAVASGVTVSAVNDAPIDTVPAAQTVAEDTPLTLGGVSVVDPDANLASVQLQVVHGTLDVSLAGGASLSGGSNGSSLLKLTGTQAQLNAALATLTYRAVADYNGSDMLTVTSLDSAGSGATDSVSISVTPVADAVNDALATDEDTTIVANVLTGAGGASADGFSGSPRLTGTGPAAHGTVSFDADGTVRYTPEADWNGSDSFTYTVESAGTIETATVEVMVAAVNDAPAMTVTALNPVYREAAGAGTLAGAVQLFADATVTTVEPGQRIVGMAVRIDGLSNGTAERLGIDGTTVALGASGSGVTATHGLQYTVTVDGGSATVWLTTTGVTPEALQGIVDAMRYQNTERDAPTPGARLFTIVGLTDDGGSARGGSDTATLALSSSVTVVATPDAPVNTVPLSLAAQEDTPLAIAGAAVNDADGNLVSTDVSVAHGTLTVDTGGGAALVAGANGSAMMRLAGTASQINAALASLAYRAAADYNGADTLTVMSTDATALIDADAIAIDVAPVADVVDDVLACMQDTPVVANVLTGSNGASADRFAGSPRVTAAGPAAHGTISFDADGTVRYTPQAGWSGTDSFAYRVESGGSSETGTVTVGVAAAVVVPPPVPHETPSPPPVIVPAPGTEPTQTAPPPATTPPTDSTPAPTDSTPAPTDSTPAPTNSTPAPAATPPAPQDAKTTPAASTPSADVRAPASVITPPAPATTEAPAPAPAAPAPAAIAVPRAQRDDVPPITFRPFDYESRPPAIAHRRAFAPLVDYVARPDNAASRVHAASAEERAPSGLATTGLWSRAEVDLAIIPSSASDADEGDRGFPVMRVPVLSATIRGAGWMIDDLQGVGIAALFVYRGIDDAVVRPGMAFDIGIPPDAFAHTDPAAIVRIEAAAGDGGALPEWLRFDAATGRFVGIAPAGDVAVRLAVVARDNAGRAVEATFRLTSSAAQHDAGDAQRADTSGRVIGGDRATDADRPNDAALMPRIGRLAAPTFSEQLREARKDALYEKVFGVRTKPSPSAMPLTERAPVWDRLSLRP